MDNWCDRWLMMWKKEGRMVNSWVDEIRKIVRKGFMVEERFELNVNKWGYWLCIIEGKVRKGGIF